MKHSYFKTYLLKISLLGRIKKLSWQHMATVCPFPGNRTQCMFCVYACGVQITFKSNGNHHQRPTWGSLTSLRRV